MLSSGAPLVIHNMLHLTKLVYDEYQVRLQAMRAQQQVKHNIACLKKLGIAIHTRINWIGITVLLMHFQNSSLFLWMVNF